MRFWNNGKINKRANTCPGEEWVSGRLPFSRKPTSNETRKKISDKLKGKEPWNKGKSDVYSEETLSKMSLKAKERGMDHIDNTGKDPWNKGKTAQSHSSIKKASVKQKGQIRTGNYSKGQKHHSWREDTPEYQRYRQRVRVITERNYKKYKEEINSENYERVVAGNDGYQLDHKISCYYGWENNIPPEVIGSKENLQMLFWRDNLSKGKKNDMS